MRRGAALRATARGGGGRRVEVKDVALRDDADVGLDHAGYLRVVARTAGCPRLGHSMPRPTRRSRPPGRLRDDRPAGRRAVRSGSLGPSTRPAWAGRHALAKIRGRVQNRRVCRGDLGFTRAGRAPTLIETAAQHDSLLPDPHVDSVLEEPRRRCARSGHAVVPNNADCRFTCVGLRSAAGRAARGAQRAAAGIGSREDRADLARRHRDDVTVIRRKAACDYDVIS